MKSGRGIASPFVEVEIVGAPYDNFKFKTETKRKLPSLPISSLDCVIRTNGPFQLKIPRMKVSLFLFFFFLNLVWFHCDLKSVNVPLPKDKRNRNKGLTWHWLVWLVYDEQIQEIFACLPCTLEPVSWGLIRLAPPLPVFSGPFWVIMAGSLIKRLNYCL